MKYRILTLSLLTLSLFPSCEKNKTVKETQTQDQKKDAPESPQTLPQTAPKKQTHKNKETSKSGVQGTTKENLFDLQAWITQYGQPFDLKDWKEYNPSPYRAYFPKEKNDKTDELIARWTDEIGPLGVHSYMHDRSWDAMPAVSFRFPKALKDSNGVAFSAIEVLSVKPGAPAEGHLKKGDLILEIDDQRLLPAQHMFLDHEVTAKEGKGLRIHVGTLIDQAEGRGNIKLKVVHLPEALRNTLSQHVRDSKIIKTIDLTKGETSFSVPLRGADAFIIHAKKGKIKQLTLKGDKGESVPVRPLVKRAETRLNAQQECPEGNWTLEGVIQGGKGEMQIETFSKPQYPKEWAQYTRTESFKIPQLGSFGNTFNPESPKAKNYAAVMAHRLAVQQQADGSWNAYSYGSPVFQTSIAALALMAQDDPRYEKNIKAAVDYICKHDRSDKWSYVNAMPPLFLAEYYLRTKDSSILPYLRAWLDHLHRFVMSDYTSGHGLMAPGYGGYGYIGAGGAVACAFAVASHTPIANEHDLFVVDKMLDRAQELAPHGMIPYGRVGKKDEANTVKEARGQGASCGSGPYYAAARIRGGAKMFTENNDYRYSHAPYGSAEHGHATQTMHFFWGMLSSAVASDKSYVDSMNDHLWKYTLYRDYDGTANKNNERTEYHNADGVIGEPYWRMASYIIHMNVYKHNLAITGQQDYLRVPRQVPMVFHADKSFYNEYFRNWALAEYALGDQAPALFTSKFEAYRKIPKNDQLGAASRQFIKENALEVAKSVLAIKDFKGSLKTGQIAALLLGVYIDAVCEPDLTAGIKDSLTPKQIKKAMKSRQKAFAAGKLVPQDWSVKINRSVRVIGAAKEKGPDVAGEHLFPTKDLTVSLMDPTKKHLSAPVTKKITETKPKKAKTGKAMLESLRGNPIASVRVKKGDQAKIWVKISYTVQGVPISYSAPLIVPTTMERAYIPKLTEVPVKGTVINDNYEAYSLGILLDKTKRILACEIPKSNQAHMPYMLTGGKYSFVVSPRSSAWAHDLRAAESLTPNYRNIKITSIDGIKQKQGTSDQLIQCFTDHDESSNTSFSGQSGQQLVFHFDQKKTVDKIYVKNLPQIGKKKGGTHLTFEAKVDGEWKFMGFITQAGMFDCVPFKTDTVRLTLGQTKGKQSPIVELNFIASPSTQPLNKATW